MNNILKSIIKKEFIHIMRDPQTLLIIFIMPLLMLFLYGYAITLEMKNIPTVINDLNHTPQSRKLIDKIAASGFFLVEEKNISEKEYNSLFQTRKARCIVIIPGDYDKNLQQKSQIPIQLLIDASDPNAANLINNYLSAIVNQINKEINRELPLSFLILPRFFYNPELKSAYFFVPGLIAIILILISALLTSIAIAREKETGTMEQILVSPVHPLDIIIGKTIPYLLIGFISGLMILFVGTWLFKVPVAGSLLIILLVMLIYVFTGLSIGLLISNIAHSQMVAMMMTLMITVLPTFMLSGFIFPVSSMPVVFRYLSNIIPAKHFITVMRGVMLKGVGVVELYKQILFLITISLVIILLSVKRFKNRLE